MRDERLKVLEEQGSETCKELTKQVSRLDKYAEDLGAAARQIMLAKWKIVDHQRLETESPDDILTCGICGVSHHRRNYRTMESDCIFNRGHLVHDEFPDCGVIFGPSKFTDQGQKGIDDDYWVHYLGLNEGNNLAKEEHTFFMPRPEKNKVYLNNGCGRWSHSLQRLREEDTPSMVLTLMQRR